MQWNRPLEAILKNSLSTHWWATPISNEIVTHMKHRNNSISHSSLFSPLLLWAWPRETSQCSQLAYLLLHWTHQTQPVPPAPLLTRMSTKLKSCWAQRLGSAHVTVEVQAGRKKTSTTSPNKNVHPTSLVHTTLTMSHVSSITDTIKYIHVRILLLLLLHLYHYQWKDSLTLECAVGLKDMDGQRHFKTCTLFCNYSLKEPYVAGVTLTHEPAGRRRHM